MGVYPLIVLGAAPTIALLGAVVIRFVVMQPVPRLGRIVSVLTVLAGVIPAAAIVVSRAAWRVPFLSDLSITAILPLGLGILAVLLLSIPRSKARTTTHSHLSRRTFLSFVTFRWVWTLTALTVVVLLFTIAAGTVSTVDSEGHRALYKFLVGTTGTSIATAIYGWHFSIPALWMLVALLAATVMAWLIIPRPAWQDDAVADTITRRIRAASIGRAAAGSILVHLSVILRSLASTAGVRGEATTTELGTVAVGPPFAALEPALHWGSEIALTAGLAMWLLIALVAIPNSRARKPSAA
ncbi:hypothetical protein [Microbacterium esteraromaticum]|uniref:hypothetical protein n=1 Tax=Microbacterium esteraromaticum TaxID=57043 RepID=UPI000B35FD7D|nr:hypothetical protein [Microbacterium esteraromaticum]